MTSDTTVIDQVVGTTVSLALRNAITGLGGIVMLFFLAPKESSVLVGGALWSAWVFWRQRIMRERMIGCLLLAGGAMTVAVGGSLTRLGHQQYLYIAMSLGVGLMFWGYLKTIRPAVPQRQPEASLAGVDLQTTAISPSGR